MYHDTTSKMGFQKLLSLIRYDQENHRRILGPLMVITTEDASIRVSFKKTSYIT